MVMIDKYIIYIYIHYRSFIEHFPIYMYSLPMFHPFQKIFPTCAGIDDCVAAAAEPHLGQKLHFGLEAAKEKHHLVTILLAIQGLKL